MGIYIDKKLCKGCAACVDVCPFGAITIVNNKAVLSEELCISCKMCVRECKNNSLKIY